jgi:farnesyl diphosphate synthase
MASLQAMSFFAKSCGILGMAGGQAMDIQTLPYSVDDMLKIHRLKTGAIIQACLVVPGILLSIPKSAHVLLEEVGLHFGLLFQVVDDILDVTQNSDTLGKTAQKDVFQDKWTAVKAYGLEGAIRLARQEADLARSLLDRLGDEGYAIHFSSIR